MKEKYFVICLPFRWILKRKLKTLIGFVLRKKSQVAHESCELIAVLIVFAECEK